jgi:hypothetical protein
MKSKIILLLLLLSFVGLFYFQYNQKNTTPPPEYYVYYKDARGNIGKTKIQEPSATPDGNIYMTGAKDPIVYGVWVGASWEVIIHSDSFDVATSFAEVIPPESWNLHQTWAPWTTRMWKVFQFIEKGNVTKNESMNDEEKFIYDLYELFSNPKNSSLRDCAEKIGEDIVVAANAGKISTKICSKKVPEDLKFDMAHTDPRFSRMKIGLFHKSFIEKKSDICNPFLLTKFSDNYEDTLEILMYNYLFCKTLATGDLYSKEIPLSEALRRMNYRFGVAISKNICNLYEETQISGMCVKIYKHLQTKAWKSSPWN